ncbi:MULTISPECIES: SPOR domain-containing protein [Thalassotalea]|uniref:SPOR domain-containing protein n=1 Tax=Thalassotalea castellviae TaxID=3075612 RepID=A0ABU3A153_9GAMM|nr:SPOR domain-containing protein [Thalassotalea sp. W431]MDT0602686.1 SPOR domain-containing protein [Thalassotalea sp. W431]
MSTPFQNRLVGTMIVAAVAIIFLPDVLDGDKKTYQEEFDKIPTAPKVDFKPQNQSFPNDKLAGLPKDEISEEIALDDDAGDKDIPTAAIDSGVQENKAFNDEKPLASVKTDEVKPQAVVKKSMPEKAVSQQAWAIQLGSFRHKKNVNELVKKLEAAGYTVFTRPIKTKNGTLTKVFVGPELIKSSLEKKIPALKTLTNVQGKVARFTPTR